jgi:hypothetical protein
MQLTLSSCFYILKSKFDKDTYINWMNNLISVAKNCNLVIYTNAVSMPFIDTKGKPNIKIIIKELAQFYNFKYKDNWIKNHEQNTSLNARSAYNTDWELNMLWSEKVWFVNETANKSYFNTEWYGWCDIGYFRNSRGDLDTSILQSWPNATIVKTLNKSKIHYACIQDSDHYLEQLKTCIHDRNSDDLPRVPISVNQQSVAGGFFIIHKEKVDWWAICYDQKLKTYFLHQYLVKDDQIILIDCIVTNPNDFTLYRGTDDKLNKWFMFQRILA